MSDPIASLRSLHEEAYYTASPLERVRRIIRQMQAYDELAKTHPWPGREAVERGTLPDEPDAVLSRLHVEDTP